MNDAVQQPEWMKGFVPGPDTKFMVGNSGNPAGRPRGISDKRAKLMKQMLDEGEDVLKGVLAKAKEGDSANAALVLNRILPALRSNSLAVAFNFDPELPIGRQIEQVLAAVAAGEVPPDVGQQIIAMIGTLSNVRAAEDLERRIIQLEAKEVGL